MKSLFTVAYTSNTVDTVDTADTVDNADTMLTLDVPTTLSHVLQMGQDGLNHWVVFVFGPVRCLKLMSADNI